MTENTGKGRVLIADDEETFLNATGDLLRREGYECDCVLDASSAAAKLDHSRYDVLVADIKMPGNPELELIHEVKNRQECLPVILVTGYPSMKSAIRSIELPVVAYLVKPIDFDELLGHVTKAVEFSRVQAAVGETQQRLMEWNRDLEMVRDAMFREIGSSAQVPVDSFVTISLHNIARSLSGLKDVTAALARADGTSNVCQLLNCPRADALLESLKETVEVLKRTKGAFKSKELGALRRRLEEVLEDES